MHLGKRTPRGGVSGQRISGSRKCQKTQLCKTLHLLPEKCNAKCEGFGPFICEGTRCAPRGAWKMRATLARRCARSARRARKLKLTKLKCGRTRCARPGISAISLFPFVFAPRNVRGHLFPLRFLSGKRFSARKTHPARRRVLRVDFRVQKMSKNAIV